MNGKNLKIDLNLFSEKGPENTEECFKAVSDRTRELGLDYVVVATTSGKTGAEAVKFFSDHDVEIAVVSHQYGFKKDGKIELSEEDREFIENSDNASLVITPDVLTRIPKITRGKYGGYNPLDLIADSLRMFSQGMKVCVECVIQAADSGKIPVEEEVAAIAGTGKGADTGIVLKSQHSHNIFEIDIKEILCLPREG